MYVFAEARLVACVGEDSRQWVFVTIVKLIITIIIFSIGFLTEEGT